MISTKADIHKGARIGKGTTVDSFSVIYEDVEIGNDCWIGPNVTIFPGSRIAENVSIYPGAVIGAISQDLKFKGDHSYVMIGSGTQIRECVTVNRATEKDKATTIGENCLIMAYAHIAHECSIGNHCILANQATLAGHVTIEEWAILEGLVAVQQFVRIGKHAFIAGASLVRKNVPPYVKAAREPLSYVGANTIGLQRRGFNQDNIQAIDSIYNLLFIQNHNVGKALEQIEQEIPDSKSKNEILEFVRSSQKGIIRGLQ
ncbi:MAG: acyl-ACP--UDP-N-acetylglucosamine O-acyltransferase [Bacteroidota bacterium]